MTFNMNTDFTLSELINTYIDSVFNDSKDLINYSMDFDNDTRENNIENLHSATTPQSLEEKTENNTSSTRYYFKLVFQLPSGTIIDQYISCNNQCNIINVSGPLIRINNCYE